MGAVKIVELCIDQQVTPTILRPCLVREACKGKKKFASESSQFEVVNEVYLQNFLHGWVINRETNLMMLINPRLINN